MLSTEPCIEPVEQPVLIILGEITNEELNGVYIWSVQVIEIRTEVLMSSLEKWQHHGTFSLKKQFEIYLNILDTQQMLICMYKHLARLCYGKA